MRVLLHDPLDLTLEATAGDGRTARRDVSFRQPADTVRIVLR